MLKVHFYEVDHNRNGVLFFLTTEITRSSAAFECGIVRTSWATSESAKIGKIGLPSTWVDR